jgi:hypothetical protein
MQAPNASAAATITRNLEECISIVGSPELSVS